jgi:phosphohistidine phosphatase
MRRLMIIRHAVAYERDTTKWKNDGRRPLTPKGTRKFRDVARQLRGLGEAPDVVLTSDLKRAVQTAQILTDYARFPKAKMLLDARPGVATHRLITSLSKLKQPYIALVGHEPSPSALISQLLSSSSSAVKGELKKGGVVLIEFKKRIRAGAACILMYVPPSVLLLKD